MLNTNERRRKRTCGLCGLEALNHRPELKILWDTFRSRVAELWFSYERRRSQKTEHGSIFCNRLRSRWIADDIAEVCFQYDRRRSQNFLRSSAIIWKPAFY